MRRAAGGFVAVALIIAACEASPETPSVTGPASSVPPAATVNPDFWVRIMPDSIQQPPGFMDVHHDSSGQLQNTCAPCHPAVDTTMTGVTKGHSGYVAVGWIFQGFHGVAWHSADGTEWTLDPALPERTVLAAVAADDARYVAVGLNGTSATAWTSLDGVSWQAVPRGDAFAADPLRLTSIVHWSGGFVAGGYEGTEFGAASAAFWWSADGLAWHRVLGTSAFENARVTGIAAGPLGLIAVGTTDSSDAPRGVVWTSADGRAWDQVPDGPVFQDGRMRSVAQVPGIGAIAAGEDQAGDIGAVWRSGDGRAWERIPPTPALGRPGIQVRLYAVAPGGPGVVVAGTATEGTQYGEGVVWSSRDGGTWTRDAAEPEFADGELTALWSGADEAVAVGDRGAPDTYIATVWLSPPSWRR